LAAISLKWVPKSIYREILVGMADT